MKILFIGTVELSLHILVTMIDEEADIVGVVTSGDTKLNSDYANLKPISSQNKIPVLLTNQINSDESVSWVKDRAPDIIFCIGWSRLLSSKILQIPTLGVIGYHPSALPNNRGRHPLIWALVLGLELTASTFFFMDEGADTGDIIDQREIEITKFDDASSLYAKMMKISKEQIKIILISLMNGNYRRISQIGLESNIWRKRNSKDGQIDWRMSASSIHNLIRGLTRPYIGAHFVNDGKKYKIWKSRIISIENSKNIEPGKVIDINSNNSPCIMCGENCIELLEVTPFFMTSKGNYL